MSNRGRCWESWIDKFCYTVALSCWKRRFGAQSSLHGCILYWFFWDEIYLYLLSIPSSCIWLVQPWFSPQYRCVKFRMLIDINQITVSLSCDQYWVSWIWLKPWRMGMSDAIRPRNMWARILRVSRWDDGWHAANLLELIHSHSPKTKIADLDSRPPILSPSQVIHPPFSLALTRRWSDTHTHTSIQSHLCCAIVRISASEQTNSSGRRLRGKSLYSIINSLNLTYVIKVQKACTVRLNNPVPRMWRWMGCDRAHYHWSSGLFLSAHIYRTSGLFKISLVRLGIAPKTYWIRKNPRSIIYDTGFWNLNFLHDGNEIKQAKGMRVGSVGCLGVGLDASRLFKWIRWLLLQGSACILLFFKERLEGLDWQDSN